MDITKIIDAAKVAGESAFATVDIDVSHLLGEAAGGTVFALRELSTARVFQVQSDAQAIRKGNPLLPVPMAMAIAELALAHVSPALPSSAAKFYEQLTQHKALFFCLLAQYKKAFPDQVDLGDAIEEAKKD